MTPTQTTYLPSKPRYEILDGLRGVAAMIVVAFHLFETYSAGPVYQIINHGYLAVDFFFVLSGFVIGYAYDDRWGKMTTWNFFKRRITRLHPMVIMGGFIGVIFYYFGSSADFPVIAATPWWTLLLVFIIGCTMAPVSSRLDIRGWSEGYPINGPQWTLAWEYLANILYAFVIRRFSKVMLAIFVLCSAFLTIDLTMNIDVFGLLEGRWCPNTVIGGWSTDPTQLYVGVTRLLYPFFAGLLLFRMGKLIKLRGGFWWCALIIAAVLAMPRLGGTEKMWMNGAYEAFCILLIFPLIVSIGAGSTVKGTRSIAICKFLGEISFPLYITHYPLIYMQMAWKTNHPDTPVSIHIAVSVSIFILAVGMAYMTLKVYDIPVREWLKKKWLMPKQKATN